MFGYIKTDLPNMYVKDTVLYKAAYCGLCKSIGKACGTNGRFLLNYDLTFFSIIVHNLKDVDLNIKRAHCILHHFIKRPIAQNDKITERIAALNIILARYKLNDNIIDSGKGRLKRLFFNKAYKKAKNLEPELDKIVEKRYDELIALEKQHCDSVDLIADPFGQMMQDISKKILEEYSNCDTDMLFYSLGKWIYLIDALDDFDIDKKSKNYNVFHYAFNDAKTKDELIDKHLEDITIIFSTTISQIVMSAKNLNYKFNHDLLDNILYKGLYKQTKEIMESKQCKKTIKS